jgi:hypothetical protein
MWPETIRTKDCSSIICAETETASGIAGPPDNKGTSDEEINLVCGGDDAVRVQR